MLNHGFQDGAAWTPAMTGFTQQPGYCQHGHLFDEPIFSPLFRFAPVKMNL